jgi:hypothetical protein
MIAAQDTDRRFAWIAQHGRPDVVWANSQSSYLEVRGDAQTLEKAALLASCRRSDVGGTTSGQAT